MTWVSWTYRGRRSKIHIAARYSDYDETLCGLLPFRPIRRSSPEGGLPCKKCLAVQRSNEKARGGETRA